MNRKFRDPFIMLAAVLVFVACNQNEDSAKQINPFDPISVGTTDERSKIVVISDLHLGNDRSYSENVAHLERLEQFLKEVRSSTTIQELVIGGDMLDEWYVPTRVDTYGGGSQADFVRKSVAANQGVFDVLNGIIKDGKIKLTYVPGNHDLGFLPENIDLAMPGINQARDTGENVAVGTYHPEAYPQIAIEHGHRYDFFSSVTPNANEEEAPGSILPPGYFFARIAANSFTDPTTQEAATKVPLVALTDSNDVEQYTKYLYYGVWKTVMEGVIYVKDDFSEPIIQTKVGQYTKTYAIQDILPYNRTEDGRIQMNLYDGLFTQENWETRLKYNHAPVMTNINQALIGSIKTEFLDGQANVQYFQNPESDVRLVVFGHTHKPMIKSYTNLEGKECLYVNSGTWEDQKTRGDKSAIDQDGIKMHFVVISPEESNKNILQIGLYRYRYGKHYLEAFDLLEL